MSAPLVTPDGRYIVVRGRLWRRSNPDLAPEVRQCFIDVLMAARRAVREALASGDEAALSAARAKVHAAKVGLGERGPVWWTDAYNLTRPHSGIGGLTPWQRLNNLLGNDT